MAVSCVDGPFGKRRGYAQDPGMGVSGPFSLFLRSGTGTDVFLRALFLRSDWVWEVVPQTSANPNHLKKLSHLSLRVALL